jgi:high-affinity nickel-transport protein
MPASSSNQVNALGLRTRIAIMFGVLLAANAGAWLWAIAAFHNRPAILAMAIVAYTFGLRHAVDADHIAAIDNVTRKLMHDGSRPVGVGLFFSLGHSTVVVLASVAVALTAFSLQARFGQFQAFGSIFGTLVSGVFLLAIALANLVTLAELWRLFRLARLGFVHEAGGHVAVAGGLLARLCRPVFRLVTRSWHMYPLGFLFGLGFDTATEIGLLGISAAGASRGLPIWSILVFPALFTAGMSLVDSLDGVAMLGAYGWAFIKPQRKIYYNLTITLLSAMIAAFIGGIELLGLIGSQLSMTGRFWQVIGGLNDNFDRLGLLAIGLFLGGWLVSVIVYRTMGYDAVDEAGRGAA